MASLFLYLQNMNQISKEYKSFTNRVFMIRPAAFGFNEETAQSNSFQSRVGLNSNSVLEKALVEFDVAVERLRSVGVEVLVAQDTAFPEKPDAIFPNNWISFHQGRELILYPMEARNRRMERRLELLVELQKKLNYQEVYDLSDFEETGRFLEGTGSVVFDHENKKAFAVISSRTNVEVLEVLCKHLKYTPVVFNATNEEGKAIYHTNVVMCMGHDFAVICLDSIGDNEERERVVGELKKSNKDVLSISLEQMNSFAGNMLELCGDSNQNLLILSETALKCLSKAQVDFLGARVNLVALNIPTIEKVGGGSARCMIAEIF